MNRLAFGHVVGYAALTIVLTAGAAQSLSGSNTVFGDDIVAGNVFNSDLASNAVTGGKVYPNTLTGDDVNESTLSLPSAPRYYRWTVHSTGGATGGDSTGTIPGPGLVVPISGSITNQAAIKATCDSGFDLEFRLGAQTGSGGRLTRFNDDAFTFKADGASVPLMAGESTNVNAGAVCTTGVSGTIVSPPAFDATVVLAVYPLEANPAKSTVIN